MADRFIVLRDDTGLTYPNSRVVFWTFDMETRKGYGWNEEGYAHRYTAEINRFSPDKQHREISYFTTIVGLEAHYGG